MSKWIDKYSYTAQILYKEMLEEGLDEDYIVESIKELFDPEEEGAEREDIGEFLWKRSKVS